MKEKKEEMIFGIRAVMEAIEAGKEIDRILVKRDLQGDLSKELFAALKGRDLHVQRVPIERINRITMKNHQGVIAFLSSIEYDRIDRIIPSLYEEGKIPFIVVLDGITDVRNFGAIARTCECAGVHAIVIPQKGSVTVGSDAVKTSAGALMRIPVCREPSLNGALKYLRDSGITLVAASEKAGKYYTNVDYTVPTAFVMGAEDTGVSNETLRLSDELIAIPQFGEIGSLNVSVATGILLYEAVKQRGF